MTLSTSRLSGAGKRVTLHNGVATFGSGPGVSVAAWQDADGFGSRDAVIVFANGGAQSVSIANPTLVVGDGDREVIMGALGATPLVIAAGAKAGIAAPRDSLAVGHLWRVTGTPTSGGTVVVSVYADMLQVSDGI